MFNENLVTIGIRIRLAKNLVIFGARAGYFAYVAAKMVMNQEFKALVERVGWMKALIGAYLEMPVQILIFQRI